MTLAAGSSRPPQTVDDLIRRWGAHQLLLPSNPRPAPSTVAKRIDLLVDVWERFGKAGLCTCDPTTVSLKYYGRRVNCNRKTSTARIMAATLEDFRAWHTTMSNRGEV